MSGADVLEALATRPGGAQLRSLGRARDDVALVGGAVRDLLLGRVPRELDVVVGADAASLAHELASVLGASTTLHGRFGTAVVEWEAGRVDVAERRGETYPAPGALPDVHPGSVEDDLRRRDFTVNAIAVPLGGPRRGELDSAEHALADLAAGRLRVLHEQSFIDDPTRLLRLARYRARLGFEPEARTAELAAEALGAGALASVTRARVGGELRLALSEPDAAGALAALDELGVLAAIDPALTFNEALARRALALLPQDGRPDLLLMASLLLAAPAALPAEREPSMFELLDGLEFTAGERERVMRSALVAHSLVDEIARAEKPSQLREALCTQTFEAVALAGSLNDEPSSISGAVDRWFQRLRHVRLSISGNDLLAAGVAAGPELGRRLDSTLARKLDGELADGHEAELAAALQASP